MSARFNVGNFSAGRHRRIRSTATFFRAPARSCRQSAGGKLSGETDDREAPELMKGQLHERIWLRTDKRVVRDVIYNSLQ